MLHVESEPIEIVGVLPPGSTIQRTTEVWEAFPLRSGFKVADGVSTIAPWRARQGVSFPSAAGRLDGSCVGVCRLPIQRRTAPR